jgi:hypothetical protein
MGMNTATATIISLQPRAWSRRHEIEVVTDSNENYLVEVPWYLLEDLSVSQLFVGKRVSIKYVEGDQFAKLV